MLGEFPVVLALVASSEAAKEAKQQVDRVIDCVGVENIRENVIMDKMQVIFFVNDFIMLKAVCT